eukprot:Lithocolla_globosa_v1_NODE_370_length_4272_cov_68.165995.p3 type:complete len:148 gc:universal NODE_370_length_4272_cov_68.165995:3301-3744(+)
MFADLAMNLNEASAYKVSQAVMSIAAIVKNFEKNCHLEDVSGTHKDLNIQKDTLFVVDILRKGRNFEYIPGRCHRTFPNFDRNPYKQDPKKLRAFMDRRVKLTSKRGKFCHTIRNTRPYTPQEEPNPFVTDGDQFLADHTNESDETG